MFHRVHFKGSFASGEELTITGEEFHHAARVARVRVGERIELFDGNGQAAEALVTNARRDALTVRVELMLPSRESPLDLTLAISIIQLEKFELVLQKATELGVRAIVPLVAARGEVRAERYRGKSERWEKIILEAVKQSGRATIPTLESPVSVEDALKRGDEKLFCDADAPASELPSSLTRATLFVGPEGGWSDEEISLARAANCSILRLGPRRLRAETAAIAATGIITARYGDI